MRPPLSPCIPRDVGLPRSLLARFLLPRSLLHQLKTFFTTVRGACFLAKPTTPLLVEGDSERPKSCRLSQLFRSLSLSLSQVK